MRRAFQIFGVVYQFLLGLACMILGFFYRELTAYGLVMDDTTSVKVVVVGVGLVAMSMYLAGRVRPSNV